MSFDLANQIFFSSHNSDFVLHNSGVFLAFLLFICAVAISQFGLLRNVSLDLTILTVSHNFKFFLAIVNLNFII